MGFGAAGYLPFVALAAIPLIIHILSRLRLQRSEFPSLLLLESVRRERFSWLRLKELLLLILRTLALLALLLALTRPYLRLRLPGFGRAGDVVVVLDDSYSMRYGSRWHRAVAAARSLVAGMGSGQRAMLLTASGQLDIEKAEWQQARGVLSQLDSVQPSFSGAVLEPALKAATERALSVRAEVVVVADLQARAIPDTWRPPQGVRVVLLDVGDERFDNAGVSRVRTLERLPLAGRPVRIGAEFRNHTQAQVTRTAVLELGGRREEKVLAIPARGALAVEFEATYSDSLPGAARVELGSDSLAADDVRWLAVTPLRRVKTLVVQSAAVPARYLTSALGLDSTALFDLTVVGNAEFGRYDARDYGVVVVTDAAALSRADWTRLGFYLQAGGAVLLMAGTAPADSTAGQGIVRFVGTARPAGFVSVKELDSLHPTTELLSRADLSSARFFSHARVDAFGGQVVARLVDGDPLIVDASEGRLVVWAFAPLPEQTDLVYKAAFVPLLHRTLAYLASAQLRGEYLVGDTIRVPARSGAQVTVVGPSRRYEIQPSVGRGRPEVVFTSTDEPGIYEFDGRLIAVNVLAEEGDLERAEAGRLKAAGYDVRVAAGRESSDLTTVMLYIAAIAFALELLLLL
jgi:hypothetical protein